MGAWQQIAPMPAARERAAAVFHAGKVYVMGGNDGGGEVTAVFIYTPETNTWTSGAPMPAALGYSCYAFSIGSKIHVVGFSSNTKFHFRYDPALDSWENRATQPLFRGQPIAFKDTADRIYLAMGREGLGGSGGYTESFVVERYTPGTNTWETLPPAPYNQQQYSIPGVMGDDGKLYCGYQTFVNDLLVYDPASGAWSRTPNLPTSPDFGAGAYNQPVSRLANGTILALPANYGPERRRRIDGYIPGAASWTLGVIPDFPGAVLDFPAVAIDPSGFTYLIGGEDNYSGGGVPSAAAYVYLENRTPNAPTLRTMVGDALVSTAATNRASHTFNDPDTGDSQSKFELRYRIAGTVTWTTITAITPNQFYDFTPGTLTPNSYERQVRTWDAGGLVGPWSTSGFFTAGDPPAGPVITYPVNGQDVEQAETLAWSTPDQDAYQVRRVADTAGAPNEAVVYYDTGEVTTALIRSLPLTFETNARTEHVQVRVKNDGLWSVWISVSVNVSYTPPTVPTFVIYPDPDTASLLLMITNPAPTVGQPAAAYNDVYVTEPVDGVVVEERKATLLPTNSSWRFWTPVSGRDYTAAIRVVAVAANGTTSSTP